MKLTKKQVPVETQKAASSNGRKFVAVEPTFGDTEDAGGFGHAKEGANSYHAPGWFAHTRRSRSIKCRGVSRLALESDLMRGAHRADLLTCRCTLTGDFINSPI